MRGPAQRGDLQGLRAVFLSFGLAHVALSLTFRA
jgi:hypothetical protein